MRRDLCNDAFAEILRPTDPDEALLNDASVVIRLVPFESVDDLIRVDGIGPARLEAIKRQNIVIVK